jgi:hypothetical protein
MDMTRGCRGGPPRSGASGRVRSDATLARGSDEVRGRLVRQVGAFQATKAPAMRRASARSRAAACSGADRPRPLPKAGKRLGPRFGRARIVRPRARRRRRRRVAERERARIVRRGARRRRGGRPGAERERARIVRPGAQRRRRRRRGAGRERARIVQRPARRRRGGRPAGAGEDRADRSSRRRRKRRVAGRGRARTARRGARRRLGRAPRGSRRGSCGPEQPTAPAAPSSSPRQPCAGRAPARGRGGPLRGRLLKPDPVNRASRPANWWTGKTLRSPGLNSEVPEQHSPRRRPHVQPWRPCGPW